MKLLPLLLLLIIAVTTAFPDSFDDEDDDVEEETGTYSKPRVAWVPILQRNVSAAVGEAIKGDKEGQEKLQRIGKMLEGSNNQWSRDAAEGDIKFRELERRRNSSPPLGLFSLLLMVVSLLIFL